MEVVVLIDLAGNTFARQFIHCLALMVTEAWGLKE